jgi:hypothetical protein
MKCLPLLRSRASRPRQPVRNCRLSLTMPLLSQIMEAVVSLFNSGPRGPEGTPPGGPGQGRLPEPAPELPKKPGFMRRRDEIIEAGGGPADIVFGCDIFDLKPIPGYVPYEEALRDGKTNLRPEAAKMTGAQALGTTDERVLVELLLEHLESVSTSDADTKPETTNGNTQRKPDVEPQATDGNEKHERDSVPNPEVNDSSTSEEP